MFGLNLEETIIALGGSLTALVLIIKTLKNIGGDIKGIFNPEKENGFKSQIKKVIEEVVADYLVDKLDETLENNKDIKRAFAMQFENSATLYPEDPELQKELLDTAQELRK